jgi:predicted nuclease of predicted toxin-antitoxin system
MSPGVSDEFVLGRANSRGALLVTADKDFGELVFRLRKAAHGVALVRLAGLSPLKKAQVAADALRTHGEAMLHAFSVITPGTVRIRSGN